MLLDAASQRLKLRKLRSKFLCLPVCVCARITATTRLILTSANGLLNTNPDDIPPLKQP